MRSPVKLTRVDIKAEPLRQKAHRSQTGVHKLEFMLAPLAALPFPRSPHVRMEAVLTTELTFLLRHNRKRVLSMRRLS